MPRISVCMPVFNTAKYLDESISSILNQSFKDLELVVVDDCSTDCSYDIAKTYAEKDQRVKLLKNEKNSGPLKSLLKAFENSSSEYFMFLDSDDYLDNDAVEIVNNELLKTQSDVLIYGYRKFDNKTGKIQFERSNKYELYSNNQTGELLYRLATNNDFNGLSRKAIRGDICKSVKVKEDRQTIIRGNDKLLSAAIYKNIRSGVIIPDIKYNYRDNSTGLTRTGETAKYNIEYRDKQEMSEVIFDSKYVDEKLKEKYLIHEYKQFVAQLMKISNLSASRQNKHSLFEQIKKEEFYIGHLLQLVRNNNDYVCKLFLDCKYDKLINYFIVRKKISKLFK